MKKIDFRNVQILYSIRIRYNFFCFLRWIGKNGSRLKQVGTISRMEIEELVGKKVYLELFVKAIKNWKEKERYLVELGFVDNE